MRSSNSAVSMSSSDELTALINVVLLLVFQCIHNHFELSYTLLFFCESFSQQGCPFVTITICYHYHLLPLPLVCRCLEAGMHAWEILECAMDAKIGLVVIQKFLRVIAWNATCASSCLAVTMRQNTLISSTNRLGFRAPWDPIIASKARSLLVHLVPRNSSVFEENPHDAL